MKCILLACAESTLLDANTNRVSLINILDGIRSPQFPILIPVLSVLAITQKDDGEDDDVTCVIKISLGDKIIFENPTDVNYQGAKMHRIMAAIQGLIVPDSGVMTIELLFNDEKVGSCEICVESLIVAAPNEGDG